MAGFPKEGKLPEIGHNSEQLAGPASLSSFFNNNQGPGRSKKFSGFQTACPLCREDLDNSTTQSARCAMIANRKIATGRPGVSWAI